MLEDCAVEVFGRNEGRKIDEDVRSVTLDASDPRWQGVARLYQRNKGEGFFGWNIKRHFTSKEIAAAHLHLLTIKAAVIPTGEECGTAYDESAMCPLCGSERVQTSPLRLRVSRLPRQAEIAQSWAGEIIVSRRLVHILVDSGITGFGLGPIQRSKKEPEEPFSFSLTHAGQELLRLADENHVKSLSP